MNLALGRAGVLLGALSATFGAITLIYGVRRNRPQLVRVGQRYAWFVVGAAVICVFAMERALLTHDFSLRYVAEHGSRRTPTFYAITTMWSALEGSILLWALILSGYLAAMSLRFRKFRDDDRYAWALAVCFIVAAFFFFLMVGPANPFQAVSPIPADGPGPNPLLQNHILVAFHPPILYLGYVGFTVPFAFCIGALVTGRIDDSWLRETRRWTLFAWAFLTAGIVLGAWWSYEVLGWGGYWAWDPVENASFIPWLTATAYLHSAVVQERRGMLRIWNVTLLIATFALTILGTFFTRSGVLDSVHAFSNSGIGPWFLTFFGCIVLSGVGLIAWRADKLRTPGIIDSAISRESAFLANNVIFAIFAFVVLLGTTFPLFAEALQGERITVGKPYFDSMTAPLGFALLVLMGVAPLLPWRATTKAALVDRLRIPLWCSAGVLVVLVLAGVRGFAPLLAFFLATFAFSSAAMQLFRAVRRNGLRDGLTGRTNGGMIVHIGVVIVAVAFAASQAFVTRQEARFAKGDIVTVAGHTVQFIGTYKKTHANRVSQVAEFRVNGGKIYRPALSNFVATGETIGTPSVRISPTEDVYITILSEPNERGEIVAKVSVLPMVSWLWVGAGVMLVGTALAAIPPRRRRITALTQKSEQADATNKETVPS